MLNHQFNNQDCRGGGNFNHTRSMALHGEGIPLQKILGLHGTIKWVFDVLKIYSIYRFTSDFSQSFVDIC